MSFFVDALVRVNDVPVEVQSVGKFATQDEACTASKHGIDEFLLREFKPGMNARTLFSRFREFGPILVIFGELGKPMECGGFNATQYAMLRCEEIVRIANSDSLAVSQSQQA